MQGVNRRTLWTQAAMLCGFKQMTLASARETRTPESRIWLGPEVLLHVGEDVIQ